MFFGETMLVSFPRFHTEQLVFSLVSFKKSIWDPSPFANMCFINIFPSVNGLPVLKMDTLKSVFSKEWLIKSKMTVFIIMDYAFGVKNSFPNPRSNR